MLNFCKVFDKQLLLLAFFSSLTDGALAQDTPWTHYGLRPLGMGNAFVAVADDFNSLFYNPAGLARLENWDGELLNPAFFISDRTSTFYEDAQDLQDGVGGGTDAVLDLMEKQSGRTHHMGFALTPHLVFPGVGFGIGIDVSSTMVFHRYPSVSIDFGPKVLMPLSYAFSFLEDKMSLGLTAKWAARAGIDRSFSIQDINAFDKKKSEKTEGDKKSLDDYLIAGAGFGADLGFLFTPMQPMAPTLGLMVSDLGGTPYKKIKNKSEVASAPPPRPTAVSVGLSLRPYESKRSYVMTSLDLHQVNLPISFSKKLHVGGEWGLGQIFKFQAGISQGYFSGGLQIDTGIVSVRAITHAVEQGEVAGDKPDRRYALQLKLLI